MFVAEKVLLLLVFSLTGIGNNGKMKASSKISGMIFLWTKQHEIWVTEPILCFTGHHPISRISHKI